MKKITDSQPGPIEDVEAHIRQARLVPTEDTEGTYDVEGHRVRKMQPPYEESEDVAAHKRRA